MDPERLFAALTDAARRVGVTLREDAMDPALPTTRGVRGGLCTIRGTRVIVIDASSPLPDRIAAVATGLGALDLEGIFLPPIVRATIGAYRRGEPARAPVAPRPLARTRSRAKPPEREGAD